MKPFFIHYNRNKRRDDAGWLKHIPRGFTAFIQEHQTDPHSVRVQVSFCSYKDEFSKKQGRTEAELANTEIVNKRSLPKLLQSCNLACHLPRHSLDKAELDGTSYNYVLKYML